MASTGVNVLRWSALGLGVVYGAYHQMSLTAKDKAAHAKKEYDAKAKLIAEAKAEFNRKNKPQSVTSAVKSEGKGFDFMADSAGAEFDLESFLHLKDGQ
ncbi:hypothetical protein BLS_000655 [Venturia inaequalis]|uniref:ATP synthase F(0) complex subunit e, mitochondrial n=1 Tax=Venturia inaequalis TaxID=5025 RepID=A0A8H3VH59_VENIN|nr:hypothetical protein BLS_000655 [Venturia inaequalis]KAE9980110.1 hypothetical protein EG328_000475 [Venturia inaequalis]KAE9986943.1 hypothetical protein EG327_004093 [Venturia inaequalis]RDI89442.1 hypothetical protein Vi05172_g236 [Venturia inaequalis]